MTVGGPAALTPDHVLAQEEQLILRSFDNDDAVDLGLIAVSTARARSLPIVTWLWTLQL